MDINVPFSARNMKRESITLIEEGFPEGARVGLYYIVEELISGELLEGYDQVLLEIRKITKEKPIIFDSIAPMPYQNPQKQLFEALEKINWLKAYDFCERLHQLISCYDVEAESRAKSFYSEEINRLFATECLGYKFVDGFVARRGRKNTEQLIQSSSTILSQPELRSALKHYLKALKFFRDHENPDFPNSVKEAVCSVEAAAKSLYPEAKASTLGDLVKYLRRNKSQDFGPGIISILTGLYTYRSGAEDVSHGEASGGKVSRETAEFILGVASSSIVLLYELREPEPEVPF